ncbi:uncharacterized protein LOC112271959 [Brachypodium distachyon]|nr:uncharacterized protein LOC112271959 [Brachypodium distachyon]|eukprot:XP_024318036.1 uncharacterized protein LOC112271959 [Brachypodium distachyon]
MNLIRNLFSPQAVRSILDTPILQSPGNDILCWKHNPLVICTIKSAYKLAIQQIYSSSSPSPIQQLDLALLNTIWASKTLIPRVQLFAWRLITRALPTDKRAGTHVYSDAAWKLPQQSSGSLEAKAGLGVYIEHFSQTEKLKVQVSVASPPSNSPLLAEAWALLLAADLIRCLQFERGLLLSDNITSQAADQRNLQHSPGHWSIRPLLAEISNKTPPAFSESISLETAMQWLMI